MPRIFITWWILFLTAGLFLGLVLAAALDGNWIWVPLWLAFAAFSIWLGLVNRRRLREWENRIQPPPPTDQRPL